jgi:hypothetical protein
LPMRLKKQSQALPIYTHGVWTVSPDNHFLRSFC